MYNETTVSEFILLGLSTSPELQVVLFSVFLLMYIICMTGNLIIIIITSVDPALNTPMYFFLSNLSFLDTVCTTSTIPNILKDILSIQKSISVLACLAQSYVFFLSGIAGFLILAVMSVDRYIAICFPLQYSTIINRHFCIQVIIGVWFGSFISLLIPSYLVMSLTFCFSEIDHFMCDVGPLLKNACTNTDHIEKCVLVSSSVVVISFFCDLYISYVNIIIAVAKISHGGKERIISACSSHAVAVSLVYGSCIFMYSQPNSQRYFIKKKCVCNE
ncbi:unnamed protein product [Staurois parvus]|uniref:Olfactory receptor n=1 Tax=Staurois parvus TaxID=386267 RepID=A0ABN9GN00_9NEOB|nr:unnamed protein product [Staurois parvus]